MILFVSCASKKDDTIDVAHVQQMAKEFMKKTVIPKMKEPRPYEIADTKVVIKTLGDMINEYRFVYDHLSLSREDSIENKKHLDSLIQHTSSPDSIVSITVNVAYKTKYQRGDVVTDSIKLGYNQKEDKISYFPF